MERSERDASKAKRIVEATRGLIVELSKLQEEGHANPTAMAMTALAYATSFIISMEMEGGEDSAIDLFNSQLRSMVELRRMATSADAIH
jgi:hypothetical protein